MRQYMPPQIRKLKNKYNFRFSKSLGQNFLIDRDVANKIIEAADIGDDDLIIEIGAGAGVLTRAAAHRGKKVTAIEIDKGLIPVLRDALAGFRNVEIVNGDILKTDLNGIIEESGCKRAKVIGNLPYYITTPIIMSLFEKRVKAESIVVMMQKEVADRIKSRPGNRAYGALSVTVAYYCHITSVTDVPREAFFPQPKTDSAVLRLDVGRECPVAVTDEKMFFAIVKAGFAQRRKTLSNALTGLGTATRGEIAKCLSDSGIDGKRRAETLSLEEFAELANSFTRIGKEREIVLHGKF